MVYLHFPSNLTEEELMLQAKYAKLKKKKKALQALKAPKQEPEKPLPAKRGTEARDAREIARKLLKSGAIQAIKSPPPLPHNATFKRPRAGRERKLSGGVVGGAAGGGVASYQPFSASQEPPVDEKASPRVKYLYDSFVTAREAQPGSAREDSAAAAGAASVAAGLGGAPVVAAPGARPDQKTRGNTLAVSGARSEEALHRRVAAYAPVHFTFNVEADKGYVTFETPELAARALTDLEGSPGEEGGTLRAAYSRRPPRDPAPSPAWASAHQQSQKQQQRDAKRSILTYDDIFE